MISCDVCVEVNPRVHLGLISMHENAPRMNGGIGFALEGPKAKIEVCRSNDLVVRDNRPFPMAPEELKDLSKLLTRFKTENFLSVDGEISISGDMRTHVGMGSGTAIRLAVIESLAVLNRLQLSRSELVLSTDRGGTSGIGVNSYFDGGLCFDFGRANDQLGFFPSSQSVPKRLPLAFPPVSLPAWPILLCLPGSAQLKTQQEETAFFKRSTPLPASASFEASYIALFELYAPAVESDYDAFCRGIARMQESHWKRLERAEYGSSLQEVSDALLEAGADCAGMSSLGPLLVCLAKGPKRAAVIDAAKVLGCAVYETSPAAHGRNVIVRYA